jgi:hypothetical protein
MFSLIRNRQMRLQISRFKLPLASRWCTSTALSVVLLTTACTGIAPQVTQASHGLLGCWTASEVETYREDGSRSKTYGECSRFYTERQVSIVCTGPNSSQLSAIIFEYQLGSNNTYTQQIAAGGHSAYAATYTKPNEFTIKDNTLLVVSYPVVTSTIPGRTVSKMVARFTRNGDQAQPQSQCRPSKPQ